MNKYRITLNTIVEVVASNEGEACSMALNQIFNEKVDLIDVVLVECDRIAFN